MDSDIDTGIKSSSDFPTSRKEISKEWVQAILRKENVIAFDTEVSDIQTQYADKKGHGETYKIILEYTPPDQNNSIQNFIIKLSSSIDSEKMMIHYLKGYHKEIFFYKFLAPKLSIPTPRVYFSAICNLTGDHCILMEDLIEARGMKVWDGSEPCSLEQAKAALKYFSHFHSKFWDNMPQIGEWVKKFDSFHTLKIMTIQIFPSKKDSFLEKYASILSDEFTKRISEMDPEFVYSKLDGRIDHLTVTHADVHLNNLLFSDNPNYPCVVIDWQNLGYGLGVRDCVVFLGTSFACDVLQENLQELKELYWTSLKNGEDSGPNLSNYTKDQFLEDWYYCVKLALMNIISLTSDDMEAITCDASKASIEVIQRRFIDFIQIEGIEKIFP